jgi:transposase-like protein
MRSLSCPNKECQLAGKTNSGNIIGYGFYKTKWGRRRRYRCGACGKTFCSNSCTPYHRLQHRRTTFDEVATLSVEGLNKSAIARAKRIGWNTVDRWLQRSADACRRFNERKIDGIVISELQADEIRTIIHDKEQPIWIFAAIEVWSRLWPSTVIGRRSYQSTVALFRDISGRSQVERVPLIATDEFAFYAKVIRPHRALKFGFEIRTPAMQAGLVSKRLSFREVFLTAPEKILFLIVFISMAEDLGRANEDKMAA